MYHYAATLCGDDRIATEALVDRVYRQSLPAARATSSAVTTDGLLASTRRVVLEQLSRDQGASRRLRLVLAASGEALEPRGGFIEELLRQIEADWPGTARRRRRGRWLLAIGAVAVLLGLVITLGGIGTSGATPANSSTVLSVSAAGDTSAVPLPGSPADSLSKYLTALSNGRYEDAAALLRAGPVTLQKRSDLRPIFDQLTDIPTALRQWCDRGALCRKPDQIVDEGTNVRALFEVEGIAFYQSFPAGTFHGAPFVRGLPMIVPTPLLRDPTLGLSFVLCPTMNVVSVTPADLDGDGWFEQIVLQHNGRSSGWSITVCGTYLNTPLRTLPPYPDVRIYPVNVTGRGADVLLVGNEDASARFRGNVWLFDPGKGGASRSDRNFDVSPVAGSDLGCLDVNGDTVPDLVQISLHYVGGTDATNSSSVDYTATGVWPNLATESVNGHVGLWPQSRTLPQSLAGYCGDRPILTS